MEKRDTNQIEEEKKTRDEKRKYLVSEMKDWARSIIIALIVASLIKMFLFNTTYVLGNSMYPTLHEKDRLIANVVGLYFKEPERGDIVLLDAPDVARKKYVKRVVAVAGDLIEIIDGRVYLNKELLVEDYIMEGSYTGTYNKNSWKVKEGEVFVLGDNREDGASKDSRFFGCVSIDSIRGVTNFRFFPLSRAGKLN